MYVSKIEERNLTNVVALLDFGGLLSETRSAFTQRCLASHGELLRSDLLIDWRKISISLSRGAPMWLRFALAASAVSSFVPV
jgi:hypothetical protein